MPSVHSSDHLTICTLGYHKVDGARHWVIKTGLEQAGHTVVECVSQRPGLLAKYRDLAQQFAKQGKKAHAILVPFQGHYIMPLAWWLARRRRLPVIFDTFISLYDTMVNDRKLTPRWHPNAWLQKGIDWLSCRLASICLIDTKQHKQYFVDRYGVPADKMLVLPVGSRVDILQPPQAPPTSDVFTVLFCGAFIPLQGVDTILQAAKQVQEQDPSIRFQIIGRGQLYPAMERLAVEELALHNTEFVGTVPLSALNQYLQKADLCLGIFGTSDKALRVIPHKVYDALACAKPVLTGDTPAIRNFLQDGEQALLSPPGNPQALAENIMQLKQDPQRRAKIAQQGHQLFMATCQPATIVTPLNAWLAQFPSRT